MELIKTGFRDANDVEYCEGDIVFNPFFGDYWVVQKLEEDEIENENCKYCFAQYGSKDLYYMDLDEPMGFKIVCHKDDRDYDNYMKQFQQIVKEIEEEEKCFQEEEKK